jgi:hypothetical protein
VDQAKGAFSAELLLQLETDLLLALALLQLTASIPDSYPGARAARDMACQLCNFASWQTLSFATDFHKLPRPANYTGPQLALQLLPCRNAPQLQQQQQPAEWCVLTPSTLLLTQLLPLLITHCLTQLQRQQRRAQRRQQQQQQ